LTIDVRPKLITDRPPAWLCVLCRERGKVFGGLCWDCFCGAQKAEGA